MAVKSLPSRRRTDRGVTLIELVTTIAIAGFALLPLGVVFVNVVDAQNEADALMDVRRGIDLVDIAVRERLINAVVVDAPTNGGHAIAFTTTSTLGQSTIVYNESAQQLVVDGFALPVTISAFQVRRDAANRVRMAFTVTADEVSLTTETVYVSVNGQS